MGRTATLDTTWRPEGPEGRFAVFFRALAPTCLAPAFLVLFLACPPALAGTSGWPSSRPEPPLDQLYDPSGRMDRVAESATRLLAAMRDRHGLDAALVLLPGLPPGHDAQSAASDIFSAWRLGRSTGGRAVLVLADLAGRRVKVEVAYGLEHVFTDLLVGEIEDRQLRPYFSSGSLDVGLIAVLEEFETRAAVLDRGGDAAEVAALDARYLSGGAGARLNLGDVEAPADIAATADYSAGATPEQAWQTLLAVWRDGVRDPDLGIYTPLGRLAYRDFTARPVASLRKDWLTWSAKSHDIASDGDVAVVSFGNTPGWDNAPMLFCRTADGWCFDLVRQRRYIRMGSGTAWGWERGDHPYALLLEGLPSWMGQDIPMRDADVYRVADDAALARDITALERRLASAPDDPRALRDLGRLLAVTAMGRKALPLLERARNANPTDPDTRWYLAVANVDAHYQYGRAETELMACVDLLPDDPQAWKYLGYVRLMNGDAAGAVDALERALELSPGDGYALEKLARAWAARWSGAMALDPRRLLWKSRAMDAFERARAALTALRARWLERDFQRFGLLGRQGEERATLVGRLRDTGMRPCT